MLNKLIVALLWLFGTSGLHAQSGVWQQALSRVLPSVARVESVVEGQPTPGVCTTFSVHSQKHLFVTAAHCNQGGALTVNGQPAAVVQAWAEADILLLVVPDLKLPAVTFQTSAVSIGDAIAAVGFANGLAQVGFYDGHVASVPLLLEPPYTHYLANFQAIQGMSGGPVFTQRGSVVGLTQFTNFFSSGSLSAKDIVALITPHL